MPTFEELIASLPVVSEDLVLLEGDHIPPIRRITSPNPRFVPLSFRDERAITPEVTSVVLITAPAAVGKSTVASEIARRIDAPLLDLSLFQVGHGFIEGTIMQAYGRRQGPDVLDAVDNGTAALIFDALDEGEVRAGSSNFEAFMIDLCALCQTPRPRPTVIVLARGETALLAELYLETQRGFLRLLCRGLFY